jgi:hypothetical protein
MFQIITLVALSVAQINASATIPANKSTPSPSTISSIVTKTSVIESEACQKTRLRNVDLMELGGFKVNKLIYLQTKAVLKDANAKSIPLSLNSTFRECAEQVSLRAQNCPSSSSAANECSPPTEKPGESLHNYGMAIDFKCSGYAIFGSSPCYTWLKENSSKYKFKQRAEEPWHWSFTGQ